MNINEDALWEKYHDLLEEYEELEADLDALSMTYEDPPVDRAACEQLDDRVERIKEVSPFAAPEIDRLREKQIREWKEADRPFWYGEMVEVAYEFNAIGDALDAVIAELVESAERASAGLAGGQR